MAWLELERMGMAGQSQGGKCPRHTCVSGPILHWVENSFDGGQCGPKDTNLGPKAGTRAVDIGEARTERGLFMA